MTDNLTGRRLADPGGAVLYPSLAAAAVLAAVVVDQRLLRTALLRRAGFWLAYGLVLSFQMVTGAHAVAAGSGAFAAPPGGQRIAAVPVGDLLLGFALVLWTLAWWVWLAAHQRPAPAGR